MKHKLYVVLWDAFAFEGVFKSKEYAESKCWHQMLSMREIEIDSLSDVVYVVVEKPFEFRKVFSNLAEANNYIEQFGFEKFKVIETRLK